MSRTFDDLKNRQGPPYNAWGLYGPDDELGRLNLITEQAVKRGRDSIQHGICVNLNLPLSAQPLNPARKGLEHHIIHRTHCNDDHVSFNTQTSTQWDGFRHYPYLNYPEKGSYVYYGGQSSNDAKDRAIIRNGIQNYVKRPITSRAHLLDFVAYRSRHNLRSNSAFDGSTPITLEMLEACAKESNVSFRSGDILLVRTGFTEAFLGLTEAERMDLPNRKVRGYCGVSQTEDILRWHWENGIAAVASDTAAYENYPAPQPPSIHEVFLAGWGMPIGELFDLRELAAQCERLQQWTFFFSSMVLNIEGGIASPPNAQAIL
ncbi:uncharacterized protein I303_107517 [Kwoniella dejecticola CBS 10117]|uniref:Cyclase n=1 Tax=Kwoniella dejecticola CBS 10117 TaxID=1296121 RepID=A0A1A5ZZX6_9TREE|nr:uncharacterized protein I303_06922 [Kwoniella dejecticola CBS 10117]OBR83357.1 hypothetical protein I303_06922 [Kwoniella dejecticola CBS 10117]